jgi:hypothetical protein
MKADYLILPIAVLAVAVTVSPVKALTACQDACNNQYFSTVNSLWQTPRPAATSPTAHQQQVMTALGTLNQCMAACQTTPDNLALNKTATATRQESGYDASKAVDGSTGTWWWAKSTSTHSLRVDLGGATSIAKVVIDWGSYYARSYQVQTSTDGSNWTTVAATTSGSGGTREHVFTARTVRHVRVLCSSAGSSNGYAIKELRVFP